MKFECVDYEPLTHPHYGVAGCYGCAHAHVGIDSLICSIGNWCINVKAPVKMSASGTIFCDDYTNDAEQQLFLCDTCDNFKECLDAKKIRDIVVRFNPNERR